MKSRDITKVLLLFVTLFIISCSNEDGYEDIDSSIITYTNTGLPVVYINTYSGQEIQSKDIYEDATIRVSSNRGGRYSAAKNVDTWTRKCFMAHILEKTFIYNKVG